MNAPMHVYPVALSVFAVFFVLTTWLGFASARWRPGDLTLLHEWVLGGRRFGTILTWFLVGGDVFTAYTFIAVPALAYGQGAIAFYAVPYTILIYPILFLVFPRLWQVCQEHNYITAGDFVRGRSGNRYLALAVSVTGIVATMPYIALQLEGVQVVIGALISWTPWVAHLSLLIAFAILAAFTYTSGLRAPASISIVKDILVYVTAFTAIIWIPYQLRGFANIFAAVPPEKLLLPHTIGAYSDYATLALASTLSLFLYPHALTGILSASSAAAIRRNAALLPAYSLVLGLLALVGLCAAAAQVGDLPEYAAGFKQFGKNFAVPAVFLHAFPEWLAGIAFAGIGIGALVPAAIMAIAAASLFTRNIYREFINPRATDPQEAQLAKWVSLIVKGGALAFVLSDLTQYAIQLQLLSVVWIIQTLPAVMLGVYTRWFNSWALLAGWLAGMVAGTQMFVAALPTSPDKLELSGYPALYALLINLIVATLLTLLLNAAGPRGSNNGTHAAEPRDRGVGTRGDASIGARRSALGVSCDEARHPIGQAVRLSQGQPSADAVGSCGDSSLAASHHSFLLAIPGASLASQLSTLKQRAYYRKERDAHGG
jgi:SSS family solute:Na+ symporter